MASNYIIQQNPLTPDLFNGSEYVRKNRSKYSNRDCTIEKIAQEIEDTGACKMLAGNYNEEYWESIAEDFIDKGYYAKLKYRKFKNGAIQRSHIVVSKLPLFDNSNYYSVDRIIFKKELRDRA